jgi:hypothetical protein
MPKYTTFSFSFFGAMKKEAVQLLFHKDCRGLPGIRNYFKYNGTAEVASFFKIYNELINL